MDRLIMQIRTERIVMGNPFEFVFFIIQKRFSKNKPKLSLCRNFVLIGRKGLAASPVPYPICTIYSGPFPALTRSGAIANILDFMRSAY